MLSVPVLLAVALGALLGYEVLRIGILFLLAKSIRQRWLTADGKVAKYKLVSSSGRQFESGESHGASKLVEASMRVEYEVGGINYESSTVNVWNFLAADNYSSDLQKQIDDEMRKRSLVTVFYDPENPSNAVIRPYLGRRAASQALLHGAVLLVGVAIYWAYYGSPKVPGWTEAGRLACYGALIGVALGLFQVRRVFESLKAKEG